MEQHDARTSRTRKALVRYLLQDERVDLGDVATAIGVKRGTLYGWAEGRSFLPAEFIPHITLALEDVEPGLGAAFFADVAGAKLARVRVELEARRDIEPTTQAKRVQDAAADFVTELVDGLTDPRTPGVLDEHELREIAPETRELLCATTGFDAAAQAVEQQRPLSI